MEKSPSTIIFLDKETDTIGIFELFIKINNYYCIVSLRINIKFLNY